LKRARRAFTFERSNALLGQAILFLILSGGCAFGQTTIVAWGDNSFGQTTSPTTASPITFLAVGAYHNLALCYDGTMIAWGRGTEGQTTVPSGLLYPEAIAAGGYHCLALKNDGTVVAWGAGRTSSGGPYDFGQSLVPPGLTRVKAIAAGLQHSLALKSDGTVVAWGDNTFSQTNVPAGLSNVVAIAAGAYHNLALRGDGTLIPWGRNDHGQASIPITATNVIVPDPYRLARPVPYPQITFAGGGLHSLAIRGDGVVIGWGTNVLGASTIPPTLANPYSIAAGYSHSLAMQSDGTVLAWGDNSHAQISVPAGLKNVVMVGAGQLHSVALVSCAPLIQNLTLTQALVPGGVLLTFCATVQGGQPLNYTWKTNFSDSAASFTTGCFSWFVSALDEEPSPYLLLDITNDCGRDFVGVYPTICAICLSRGTPSLLNGVNGSATGPTLTTPCGVLSSSARWYKMLATNGTGPVTISTEGSSIATHLTVYTGSLLSPQLVACSGTISPTDLQSRATFQAVQGTRYWIVADPGASSAVNLRVASGFVPRIATYGLNPDGSFHLQSSPAPAIPYMVLSTTNPGLALSSWHVELTTNLSTGFPYIYYRETNATSAGSQRFYRIVP